MTRPNHILWERTYMPNYCNTKLVTLKNALFQLAEDEFAEADILADLDIAYNQLKSLNGSLRHLKNLRYLNLTHNLLTEFSLQEIKGLKRLSVIDLSQNKISFITGKMEVIGLSLK